MKERLLTPYLWLAGLYVAFGLSVARGDVWTNAKPPALANSSKSSKSSTVKQSVQYRIVAGHSHYCKKCKLEWWHSDEHQGDEPWHQCPRCGKTVWNISRYGPVSVPVKVQPAKPAIKPCPD